MSLWTPCRSVAETHAGGMRGCRPQVSARNYVNKYLQHAAPVHARNNYTAYLLSRQEQRSRPAISRSLPSAPFRSCVA